MKRFLPALILLIVLGFAAVAWAEGEEVKPSWTEAVKVGGFVDVRPSFYWFTPTNGDLDEQHVSDVSLYEAGIQVTAKPFEAVRGVAVAYYGEANRPYLTTDLGQHGEIELTLDEAYVQLGDDKGPFLRAGKYYMPIGLSETFGMEDTLMQRWTQNNPVALGLGYNHKYFGVSAHMFNGLNDTANSSGRPDNNIIDTYVAGLDFYPLAMFEKYSLDIGGYFLTDATETFGNLRQFFNGTDINYSENVPLYGGYLVGKFTLSELLGLGIRGEYATTGKFEKEDYVNAAGDETGITWMNGELAFLFWEGVVALGGKYESISGLDYFGLMLPNVPLAPSSGKYEPTSYYHAGGFLTTNLMEELTIGLEYLYGADNEDNTDMELQIQTRLDF